MGRDNERYVYLTVSLPRDSQTLQLLLADAKERGMEEQLAKLLSIRIADFYQGTTTRHTSIAPEPVPLVAEPAVEEMNEQIAIQNANAALDEWM